ncbi:MAG TPA: hypothetical protein VFL99_08050 [Segeticoccus sp.]|uniref:hypothetical protein n=1 Tax=Segeticoccus sp. TaxID=2706531 RepID=UPI002D7F7E88|nr:hypothetical protein [Segeticoccus sp.]HET8600262.1 hypothetical protein [Segeticoccus sp.]
MPAQSDQRDSSALLPVSVRLALWCTAAYAGQLPLPQALARAHPDVDHVGGDLSRLELWRDLGESVVLVSLPRPGDVTGMPSGSLDLVGAATAAGECAFVPGIGGALVPAVEAFGPEGDQGTQVVWTAYDCDPVPTHRVEALSLGEIEMRLREDLLSHTSDLEDLDVRPWAGSDMRRIADERLAHRAWGVPESVPRRALRVLSLAGTVSETADLGLEAGPTGLNSVANTAHRAVLTQLRHVAERALADATNVAALTIAGALPS